ncbi:MAG: CUB domain-containing protein, partial [Flavobacteriales bacterium]
MEKDSYIQRMGHVPPERARSTWKGHLFALLIPALMPWTSGWAQVATAYTFTASAGSYQEITGGTTLWSNSFDDNVSGAQAIPSFLFNGTAYTNMFVSANGFITFGSAPGGGEYSPLSSGATYARCVAAFATDLINAGSGTRDVRWQTVDDETIIQWRGVRRYRNIFQTWAENYSFQIRLDHATGAIRTVYGPITQGPANSTNMPQVGLRGPSNAFATNVNNRLVGSGSETWGTPLPGTANNSTLRFTGTAPAKSWTSGQTYTWTPVCVAPAATFTVVENCAGNSYQVNVDVNAFGIGGNGTLSYEVNGGSTQNVALTGTGTTTIGPFQTADLVTARVTNVLPGCSTADFTAYSTCPRDLNCNDVLTVQHCYSDQDARTFTYRAGAGNTVNLVFISGTIDPSDIIRIHDGEDNSAPLLASSTNVNLSGLTATSTGESLYMEIDANASNSCATGQQSPWTFEVRCTPNCVSPDGAVSATTDCGGSSFSLNVEVLFTGDAPTTTLWYSVDGGPAATVPGLMEFDVQAIGPFPLTSEVNVRLLHGDQAVCDRNLGTFTRDQQCPPPNDQCASATLLSVKSLAQCPAEATIGTTLDAASETGAPGCTSGGPVVDTWYRFNSGHHTSPIRINLSALTAGHYGVELYAGCGGTLISCNGDSPAFVDLANAAPWTEYWVRVFTNASLGSTGTFSICITATPAATACGQVIRDPGGTGNYANNQNVTTTYCSGTAGEAVTMTFSQFTTELGYDFVRVYDGPGTASPLLGTFSGSSLPGPFTSTHPSGCLTLNFTSDFSNTAAGYTASLSCCVNPAPSATAANNGPVCSGDDIQLSVSTNSGTVFSWTGPNGFSSSDQAPLLPDVGSAASGTYTVTVQNGVNGCAASASTTVNVNDAPEAAIISPASPEAFCAGGSVQLTASGGSTTGTVITGGTGSTTTGNTTGAALGPNPMQNYYGGAKQQMLWRASELSALGLSAGSQITSIAIDLATANAGYALNNFRIKYQWSSGVNALSTTPVSTGWTLVFPAQSVTPQVGFNTFTFTSPITWNGTDNLLVEMNFSNNNTGASGTFNTATYTTGVGFNATSFYRADNSGAAAMNQYAMTMTNVYASRNHIRFGVVLPAAWTWSPSTGLSTTTGNVVNAGPSESTTYTATSTNAAGCASAATVLVNIHPLPAVSCGGPYGPFCPDQGVQPLTGTPAGGTWTGTGVSGNAFDPATAGAGTHSLTYSYTDGNGCSNSCSVSITVNATPVVSCGSYGPYCSTDGPVSLAGSPAGGTWSGAGVSGNTFNPAVGTSTLTYAYTDANGCSASCQTTITVTTATAWYADADNDGHGDPSQLVMACTQPPGHVSNSNDNCPAISGLIGEACDAGAAYVLGQIDGNCACVGQACTTDLTLEFTTDMNSFETTWELRSEGTDLLVQSGGGWYPPNATLNDQTCLPDGCYVLRVLDAGGDGMTNGGYILRTQGTNERIIDNRNNFNSGSMSVISGGQSFCLPMGLSKPIYTSCDKLDWMSGQFVVASPEPAVSAEWIPNAPNNLQDNNSGYEFWIFDPNGGYSFRRFRSHNQSDGYGPASATRACHMKLNNWSAANHVPANRLMNIRVRSRVNGVNAPFGPACRLAIDPVLAACPRTKLMDIPNDPDLSCGAIRPWGSGNFVHARPVSGANRYQFRFRLPAEGFEVVRTSTSYFLQLNWSTLPLQNGKTYDVDVRVSRNGGVTWCTEGPTWGDICQFTIGNSNVNAMTAMVDDHRGEQVTNELRMYPNPNRGDVLTFSLSSVEQGV